MPRAFLVGRILVGGYYVAEAFNHFTHSGLLARAAALHGVPAPTLAVLVAGVLLLIGGLSLLLGLYPRMGVLALGLFFVPVTLIMHAFWADHDPVLRMNDFINFSKNVALFGSALMFLGMPQPWPYSVERQLHRPVHAQL